MLTLKIRTYDAVFYDYIEDGVIRGNVTLKEKDETTAEIICLQVYEERQGYGTRCVKEMLETLSYTRYVGTSRYKYYPFWAGFGAKYTSIPTAEEIALDEDDDETVAEFLDFTLEPKR